MPRWRDAPDLVLKAAHQIARVPSADPRARRKSAEADREAAESEVIGELCRSGGRSLARGVQSNIRDAQRLLPYREIAKNQLMKGYELIRAAIEEFGRRSGLSGRTYFLRWSELISAVHDPNRYSHRIDRRMRQWSAEVSVDLPEVIAVDELERIGARSAIGPGAIEMPGFGLSHGVATGVACLVVDGCDVAVDGNRPYVLVCPSLDLSHASLLIRAAGLIVERGGVLSHAAVVARQFGIPAVVVPDATQRIAPGETVEVDANRGIVTRKAAR